MKPRNFPARKAARQGKPATVIAAMRGVRTKKTPPSTWSAARIVRRRGKGV
jgi:hypothetical protein